MIFLIIILAQITSDILDAEYKKNLRLQSLK